MLILLLNFKQNLGIHAQLQNLTNIPAKFGTRMMHGPMLSTGIQHVDLVAQLRTVSVRRYP